MGGLARICKAYGAMVINGQRFVWDYARDEAVSEAEMKADPARRRASGMALAELLRAQTAVARAEVIES